MAYWLCALTNRDSMGFRMLGERWGGRLLDPEQQHAGQPTDNLKKNYTKLQTSLQLEF
jgi:hypothetical protein